MKRKIFVAHVFSSEYIDDLRKIIYEVCSELILIPTYADDYLSSGHILKDKIFPQIDEAVICLFEISETQKPNVFIELGYSFGKNKPSVLLIKKGVTPPSDIAGFDRIEYSSFQDLKQKLLKNIPSLVGKSIIEEPLYKTSNGFRNLLYNHRTEHDGLILTTEFFKEDMSHVSIWTKDLVATLNSSKPKNEKTNSITKYLKKLDKTFNDSIIREKNRKNHYFLAKAYIIIQQYLKTVEEELND